MKILIGTVILLSVLFGYLTISLVANGQPIAETYQVSCAPEDGRDSLLKWLFSKWGESVLLRGLTNDDNQAMFFTANAVTKTWTLITRRTDGWWCIYTAGKYLEVSGLADPA